MSEHQTSGEKTGNQEIKIDFQPLEFKLKDGKIMRIDYKKVEGNYVPYNEERQKKTGLKALFWTVRTEPLPEGGHRNYYTYYQIKPNNSIEIVNKKIRVKPDGTIVDETLFEIPITKILSPRRTALSIASTPDQADQEKVALSFLEISFSEPSPTSQSPTPTTQPS
ncbi:MAG: hypothetical protein QHH09_00085 [Microgenomates group bacterium]|jgi:hypothetical protein|nr:hypothetical protein [Microgenomates group bacterium]